MGSSNAYDSSIQKLRTLISYSLKWRKQDFQYEQKINPNSYMCGFDAGSISAFSIISECLDEIEKVMGEEDG